MVRERVRVSGGGMLRLVAAAAVVAALSAGASVATAAVSGASAPAPVATGSSPLPLGHEVLHILHGGVPGSGVTPHTGSGLDRYGVSDNWSGQIATGGTYTSVTGDWVVPQVTHLAPSPGQESATWIGIDGVTSQSLIQTGTAQESGLGWARYFAWYELLPGEAQPIDHTVDAGDRITASVSEVDMTTSLWKIEIADTSRNWSFSQEFTYVTPSTSAEWIEEAPSIGDGRLAELNDYGSVTFTDMTVASTVAPIYTPFYMEDTDDTGIISWPDLYDGGGSFTVRYGSPTPVITSVTPATGPDSGDSVVNISGQFLFAVADIAFGVEPAPAFYLNSDGSLTAASPPGAGTVDILVSSVDVSSSPVAADHFVYSSSAPALRHGYWLVGADGGIFTFGSAGYHGSTGDLVLQRPVVGIAPTADHDGYWLVATDGGVFAFGDAGFYGSIPGLGIAPAGSGAKKELNAPIVGIVPSVDDRGYFMVAADGGVFAFGDAKFEGSCPVYDDCDGTTVSVMPDATGLGYWVVTDEGYVYSFGDAPFEGEPAWTYANGPLPRGSVTGAVRTPDGQGYWILVGSGYVLPFGDANLFEATHGAASGSATAANAATAVFATGDTLGYWVATADGAVFDYGDAPADGSMAGHPLNAPIIAATGW